MNSNELYLCPQRYMDLFLLKPKLSAHVFWFMASTMDTSSNKVTSSVSSLEKELMRSKPFISKCIKSLIKAGAILEFDDGMYINPLICVSPDNSTRTIILQDPKFKDLEN